MVFYYTFYDDEENIKTESRKLIKNDLRIQDL